MAWGEAASGALGGAGTGAAIGSIVPGVGTAIGAGVGGLLGGIGGWFSGKAGEEESAEAQRRIAELLGASEYQGFGQSEAGMELRRSLESQIESQYKQQLRGGLGRAAHTAQSRGMLSSSVLPGLQMEAQRMASEQRGQGYSQLGQTMGGLESAHMQQWQQQELAKKMQAAGYWQQAGQATQGRFGDLLGMLFQGAGTAGSLAMMRGAQ